MVLGGVAANRSKIQYNRFSTSRGCGSFRTSQNFPIKLITILLFPVFLAVFSSGNYTHLLKILNAVSLHLIPDAYNQVLKLEFGDVILEVWFKGNVVVRKRCECNFECCFRI